MIIWKKVFGCIVTGLVFSVFALQPIRVEGSSAVLGTEEYGRAELSKYRAGQL